MKLLKNVIALTFLVTVAMSLGCAYTGLNSKTGRGLISNFTEGLAISDGHKSSKIGEACTENILGVYSRGDASIEAAKRNGNISQVASVDQKFFAIFNFYGSVCTIVRGE